MLIRAICHLVAGSAHGRTIAVEYDDVPEGSTLVEPKATLWVRCEERECVYERRHRRIDGTWTYVFAREGFAEPTP